MYKVKVKVVARGFQDYVKNIHSGEIKFVLRGLRKMCREEVNWYFKRTLFDCSEEHGFANC